MVLFGGFIVLTALGIFVSYATQDISVLVFTVVGSLIVVLFLAYMVVGTKIYEPPLPASKEKVDLTSNPSEESSSET